MHQNIEPNCQFKLPGTAVCTNTATWTAWEPNIPTREVLLCLTHAHDIATNFPSVLGKPLPKPVVDSRLTHKATCGLDVDECVARFVIHILKVSGYSGEVDADEFRAARCSIMSVINSLTHTTEGKDYADMPVAEFNELPLEVQENYLKKLDAKFAAEFGITEGSQEEWRE